MASTADNLPPIKGMMRPVMFADTQRGGYIRTRHCDELGFSETIKAETRRSPSMRILSIDGDPREFCTIAEFKAAYYELHPERLEAALAEMKAESEGTNG